MSCRGLRGWCLFDPIHNAVRAGGPTKTGFRPISFYHMGEGSSGMKIKCPECGTSYDIKAEALGAEGRSVKCARCGNRWHVEPPSPAPVVAPQDPVEADVQEWERDTEAEKSATADPVDDTAENSTTETAKAPTSFAAPEDPDDLEAQEKDAAANQKSSDVESQASRTKIKVNPYKHRRDRIGAIFRWLLRRNYRRISGVILFAASLLICLFLVLIRNELVKKSPDLASLFQTIGLDINLRGLEFRDIRTFRDVAEGKPALVIEGSIHNIKSETVPVPAVRLSLRDVEHQEIYAWTIEPKVKSLDALDETRFRTILTDFPTGVDDIQVRFVDRTQGQTSR